jgi:hypothetical protein
LTLQESAQGGASLEEFDAVCSQGREHVGGVRLVPDAIESIAPFLQHLIEEGERHGQGGFGVSLGAGLSRLIEKCHDDFFWLRLQGFGGRWFGSGFWLRVDKEMHDLHEGLCLLSLEGGTSEEGDCIAPLCFRYPENQRPDGDAHRFIFIKHT